MNMNKVYENVAEMERAFQPWEAKTDAYRLAQSEIAMAKWKAKTNHGPFRLLRSPCCVTGR